MIIFSTPKPWRGEDQVIQINAVRSWRASGESVCLLGDDDGTKEAARELTVDYYPYLDRNEHGTPLFDSVFKAINILSNYHPQLIYVNADILLPPKFFEAVKICAEKFPQFLMVGRRWNVEITEEITLGKGWADKLLAGKPEGQLSRDYFAFTTQVYKKIPPFALGRGEWDCWMVGEALARNVPVVDVSRYMRVFHQNHDFGHLPGKKRIKRGSWASKGPETDSNRALIKEGHPAWRGYKGRRLKPTHYMSMNGTI